MEDTGSFLAPALLTGTSGEFMGRKPLPRLLRTRHVVFVLGPEGVGKSTVARLLSGPQRIDLDSRALEHSMIDRVRKGGWAEGVEHAPSLLVESPVWLRSRAGARALLLELARLRSSATRRTVFCDSADGSVTELIGDTEPGSAVVVGLRFPTGRKSRLRCARQMCKELGLPIDVADGSDLLDPWRYDRLWAYLLERAWGRP